jgi:hypothetical protein
MARLESLDQRILQVIARQVADKSLHHRRRNRAAAGNPPMAMAENFRVWTLDPQAAVTSGGRLRNIAKPTGHWHHQLRHSGAPEQYARSMQHGPNAEDWRVVGFVTSQTAAAIDRAIEWLDRYAGVEEGVVGLLEIPSHQMTVLWLESPGEDKILLVSAPEKYETALGADRLHSGSQFLTQLAGLPPASGVPVKSAGRAGVARIPIELGGIQSGQAPRILVAVVPLVLLAALALGSPLLPWQNTRQIAFIVTLVLMSWEFAAIGVCLRRSSAGVIIDARNCMSLSRFQACAWTVLILSALLVGAAFNLSAGSATALNINIPPELLVAMGISATSLAMVPAVLSLKTKQQPSAAAVDSASAQLTPPGAGLPVAVPRAGTLIKNTSVADASWTDMITGDEVGNFAMPDLGKIQQLLVTFLLLGVYLFMIWHKFAGNGIVDQLPKLDQSFIWLLGVSHATYLAIKAAPHTP